MAEEKKVSVAEMFPDKNDFNDLMEAFDKYHMEADGSDIKSVCLKNKDHLESLGVKAEWLPFYFMKRLIDRAIEQANTKNEAVEEVEEMVKNLDGVEEEKENFEKEEVNNILHSNNDAENKSEEEVQGETATGDSITEAESVTETGDDS